MRRLLWRSFIALTGGTVLLIGVVMIPLPGPSILAITAGLAILALEFAWAERWLHKVRQYLPGRKEVKSQPGLLPMGREATQDPTLSK